MWRWIVVLAGACPCLSGCGPGLQGTAAPVGLAASNVEVAAESNRALSQDPLQQRLQVALSEGLHGRSLNAQVNAAWQIMHGVIPYGQALMLETPDRGRSSAVQYALTGGQINGFELMAGQETLSSTGRPGLKARLEPGSYIGQGHVDQWLAIFAMAGLPLETPVEHDGQQFTLIDWARQAQHDVTRNMLDEYSWTLIALTHYFPDEPQWQAAAGQTVSWEQLVDVELDYDLVLSPCGGTHRLAGLTRAVQAKQRLQLPDTPVWQQAEVAIERALNHVREYRAPNGRLSSFYLERAGTTADVTAELASSGHLFEFAALALPESELSAAWMEAAAGRICDLLTAARRVELDCGALYHALNGLKIYHERRFGTVAL